MIHRRVNARVTQKGSHETSAHIATAPDLSPFVLLSKVRKHDDDIPI